VDLFRAGLLSRSLRKILRGAAQDDTEKRRGGNVAAFFANAGELFWRLGFALVVTG